MFIVSSTPRPILSLVAAQPGWRVDAFAPRSTSTSSIPTPSHVVAWALVTDESEAGGSRVDPVFFAGERTWTPDQFRAAFGAGLELKVVPG